MPLAGQVVELQKHYDLGSVVVKALRGVSADFPEGDFVAIMGSSGSGKSTLLNILGGLDRPTLGKYLIAGHDVSRLTDDQLSNIRNRMIGFIFQSYNLIPQYTVLENIAVPLHYRSGYPRIGARERNWCIDLASKVGLADRLDHRPYQLSGGQQQRVAIARALVNDPQIVLADEPTGNLDTSTEAEIMDILLRLNAEGRTILMVTHEPNVATMAKRQIVLQDGIIANDQAISSRTTPQRLPAGQTRITTTPVAPAKPSPPNTPKVSLSEASVPSSTAPSRTEAASNPTPGRLTVDPPKTPQPPTPASSPSLKSSSSTKSPTQTSEPPPGRLTITPSESTQPAQTPAKQTKPESRSVEPNAVSKPASGRLTVDPPKQAPAQQPTAKPQPNPQKSTKDSAPPSPSSSEPGRLTITPPKAAPSSSNSPPTKPPPAQPRHATTSSSSNSTAAPGRLTVTPPKNEAVSQPTAATPPEEKSEASPTETTSKKPAKISASAALEKLINAPKGRITVTPDETDSKNETSDDLQPKAQVKPADQSVLDAELGSAPATRLTQTPPPSQPRPRKKRQSPVPEPQPDQRPQALEGEGDKAKTKITLTREQLEALLRQQQLMTEQRATAKQTRSKKPSDAFYEFLADQDEPE